MLIIELQIRPNDDVFEMINNWHLWMSKYTHFPESANPNDPVNHQWLVYKREASLPLKLESKLVRDAAQLIIFGEANWNYMTGRYISSIHDAASLAALLLQISLGDYNPEKYTTGYLW